MIMHSDSIRLFLLEINFRNMKALVLQEAKTMFYRLLSFIIIEHDFRVQINVIAG